MDKLNRKITTSEDNTNNSKASRSKRIRYLSLLILSLTLTACTDKEVKEQNKGSGNLVIKDGMYKERKDRERIAGGSMYELLDRMDKEKTEGLFDLDGTVDRTRADGYPGDFIPAEIENLELDDALKLNAIGNCPKNLEYKGWLGQGDRRCYHKEDPLGQVIAKIMPPMAELLEKSSGVNNSSAWGMRGISGYKAHQGIDVGTGGKTNVKQYVAWDGKVVEVNHTQKRGSYGRHVRVQHDNGIMTTYNHLNSVSVTKGQSLKAGDQIGVTGGTYGFSPHMHFEIVYKGQTANPYWAMKASQKNYKVTKKYTDNFRAKTDSNYTGYGMIKSMTNDKYKTKNYRGKNKQYN